MAGSLIPNYLQVFTLWLSILWPLVTVSGLIPLFFPQGRFWRGETWYCLFFCFSLMGITIGFLASIRQQAILSIILPTILMLFPGGLILLMAHIREESSDRRLFAQCTSALFLSLLLGFLWGHTQGDF